MPPGCPRNPLHLYAYPVGCLSWAKKPAVSKWPGSPHLPDSYLGSLTLHLDAHTLRTFYRAFLHLAFSHLHDNHQAHLSLRVSLHFCLLPLSAPIQPAETYQNNLSQKSHLAGFKMSAMVLYLSVPFSASETIPDFFLLSDTLILHGSQINLIGAHFLIIS